MSNIRVILDDELANAPELPLGLPAPYAVPARNLDLPVDPVDTAAADVCVAVLGDLDPQHAARVIRFLVARFHLVDLW